MLDTQKKGRNAPTPGPILDASACSRTGALPQQCNIRSPVEMAWHRYRALVLQAAQDPQLLKDTWHRRSMARAHSAWSRLFVGGTA